MVSNFATVPLPLRFWHWHTQRNQTPRSHYGVERHTSQPQHKNIISGVQLSLYDQDKIAIQHRRTTKNIPKTSDPDRPNQTCFFEVSKLFNYSDLKKNKNCGCGFGCFWLHSKLYIALWAVLWSRHWEATYSYCFSYCFPFFNCLLQ